ncbi:MAG: hypothetical protein RBS77_01835 [Candidatus Moranbacteria bacterium]|jgi:hypothetical protein|nr:hypothetical protein [Candidatus Moranbacteria bacterium]
MKFTTIVLIGIDSNAAADIRANLPKQSKEYVSDDMITLTSALMGEKFPKPSSQEIAFAISEIKGTEVGVDENGIYEMLPVLKQELINRSVAKIEKDLEKHNFYDAYNVFDLLLTDDFLKVIDSYDRFPDVIITPDNQFIRASQAFMYIDAESSNYKEFVAWKERVKKILQDHANTSYSLVLDCHA